MSGRSLSDEGSTRSASWCGWGEEVGMHLPPQAHRRESGLASPQRTQAASAQVYRTVVHRLCKHHCSNHIIRHSAGLLGTWLLLMYFIISFFFTITFDSWFFHLFLTSTHILTTWWFHFGLFTLLLILPLQCLPFANIMHFYFLF